MKLVAETEYVIPYHSFLYNVLWKFKQIGYVLKVAFIQMVLMHLSFPQTDKPYYSKLSIKRPVLSNDLV